MPSQVEEDYQALNNLIVNCKDLRELEKKLGGFNLFQVLKFEYGEIRHSNVLSWILDPAESHGLGDLFLKTWLMRVIHESNLGPECPISPIDIDVWELHETEVRREWRNIDLLVVLTFVDKTTWVVCIENKINSFQHSSQLVRYKEIVDREFGHAEKKLFIFLTKNDEAPEETSYLPASFSQVHKVMEECLESRKHAIGAEPLVLIQNYLQLLKEKFMNESDIATLAQRIYSEHRRALDIIFEHRPDNLRAASSGLYELFARDADELGIVMDVSTKAYIRFVPKEWDQPGNKHGSGWPGSNRTILFEISLRGAAPSLYVIMAKAPDPWMEALWEISAKEPFHRPKRPRPKIWCGIHFCSGKIALDEESLIQPSDSAQKIFDWACKFYESEATKKVVQIVAEKLPELESIYVQQNQANP